MFVWITHDGKLFNAATEESLVEQLRKDTIIKTDDIDEFMLMMSCWTKVYNQVQLDTQTPETFVQSLLDNDLLTKWSKN